MDNTSTILQVIPNLVGGGAERVAINLAHSWLSSGYNAEFVLIEGRGELLESVDSHVKIHSLNCKKFRHALFPLLSLLRKRHPDVILVHMWPLTSLAILAWLLAGKPGRLFTLEHNSLSISCVKELKVSAFYLQTLLRFTYPFATGRVAVSYGVSQDLCKLGNLPVKSVKVIYNPIIKATPYASPCQSSLSDQLWGFGFTFHILAVGSLKPKKNFPLLLRAFALLPNFVNAKLVILGEGHDRKQLESLIQDLGLGTRVSMPGFHLDTSSWYSTAHLFVLSSSWEGLPTVLIEALHYGLPIVSTDCPNGPSEILENGKYGRLVPVNDPTALSDAILASLYDDHNREQLCLRALDFEITTIADHYLTYFKSMGARV